MAARPSVLLALVGTVASMGASYRTQNFVVEAPTPQFAEQIGRYAEYYRRQKAQQWLGQEMQPWGQPCPVRVTVTMNGSGGATSFAFDNGRILGIDMHIEGAPDRLVVSVLPHEVTHTVFAYYFRCPMPRWADEGGSVLSEDEQERNHHEQLIRQILRTPGRTIPLRRLFSLREYPRDVMVLYAEGYSVTSYLVGLSDRPRFLRFIAQGMRGDWDGAVRANYGYNSVEDLERAWVQHVSTSRPGAPVQVAGGAGTATGDPRGQVVVRQTLPPAQPLLEAPQPVYRGTPPGPEEPDTRVNARPTAYTPPAAAPAGWSTPPSRSLPPTPGPGPVQLLPPQFDPAPPSGTWPRSPVGQSP
jgi:hypothetical protein